MPDPPQTPQTLKTLPLCRVCVRTDHGDVDCTVSELATVATVKQLVMGEAWCSNAVWLRFAGVPLLEEHTLAYYGIGDCARLSLEVRARGGGGCMSTPHVRAVPTPASSAEDELDVRIRQLEEHLVSLVRQPSGEAVDSNAAGDGQGQVHLLEPRAAARKIIELRELPRPQLSLRNRLNIVPLPTSKVQTSGANELKDASRMTVSTRAENVATSAETVSTSAETLTFVRNSRQTPDLSGGGVRSSQDQATSSNSDVIKDDKLKKVYPTSTTKLLLTPGSQALMMQPVQGQHKADFSEKFPPEAIRAMNSVGRTPDMARIDSDKIKDASKRASTDSVLRANLQSLLQKIESDALHQKDEIVLKQSRSRQRSVTKTPLVDFSQKGDAVGLHKLVQEGDVNSIIKMHSSLSLPDWGRVLFSRDTCDLTPLALACHLGSIETTSQLLFLGAARSIFVCGFMPGEFLCTLPFARVVPESHISREGREIAERKARLFDHQKLGNNDKLQTAIDSALELHIKQLVEGNVDKMLDFPQLNASENAIVEVEPKGASEEMSKGDIVRLRANLKRSSILVSWRGTDNTVASDACLGAHSWNQLGIVVHIFGEILAVASLSSGHVCEYASSDLVFADGSSFVADGSPVIQTLTEIKCPSGHIMKRLESSSDWICDVCKKSQSSKLRMRCRTCDYDLCNKCESHCGSPKPRSKTQGSPSSEEFFYKFGDTVTLSSSAFGAQFSNVSSDKMLHDPQPKIGMTVKATSGKGGAPSGKSTRAFSKGEKIKITKLKQENGQWFAIGEPFDTLWFPLSSTDWKTRTGSTADSAVGCCTLTTSNFSSGLKVVRGPDWKWGDQDGGAGSTGVLKKLDGSGWATVKWSHGGSNVYRISSAADLQLVSSDCKCGRNAKAASSSSAAAANGTSLASIGGGSTEWMPSTEDVLVVCSVFHACSDRGIVVCRLHDTSRLWLVTSSELQRVRAVPYEHIYKKGDFVKLDSTCTGVSAAKCLGAPSEDRWGVVIGAGASRRGIQRNIEVVLFVELADNGEGFEPVVSLYSSLDLLLVPRCVQRLEEDEKQSLIDTLKQLSESTKIAFNVPVLVNKLGLDVFSKLWPLFADANAYSAAYLAFCKWQKSRASPSQLLPEPIRKLLEQRNFHEQTCEELNAGAFQFAKDWFAALDVKEVTGGKWQCKDCGIDNRALSMKCEVCGSMAPSWKCVWCMQNNADAYSSCKHCNHPKDGDSCVANVPSGSGGAPHRIETNPDRRPMPFQFLDGFSAKPPAAAIANCSIGIPYGCRVRVQSDCVNNGKVGRVLCVTTLPLDEMTVSSKADNTTEVARAVTITGVEGANDKLLNGTYLLVEGARCEGKPFYMKEDSFLHEGSVRIEYNSTKVCWQVKSQKQGEAIKCTERAVDESIPETWTADVHYQIKDSDCFEKDEICVIKRSDGSLKFGRIMKVESKNEYTVAVTNDTSKRGKSGDNIGKILPYAESFDSLLHMHTMGFYSEALEDFAGDWNVMKGSLNLPEIQKGITVVKQPLAYKCEIIVEAGVQIMTVKAENLSRLPEEPSNVTLSSSSCQEESIAAPKIPWRVGALARCIGRSGRFSGLGRESKMCCISAVNLEQNKVSVCVTTQEGTLSELGVATIGDLVCLANRHHDVIDGPLVPGQRATILAIDNNLVLVQVLPDKSKKEAREGGFSFTAPQPGAFGFAAPPQPGALSFTRTQSNGFDEKTNWWYHAQVLAPYEFSSALPAQASSSHTISCTPVAKSGCANRGVFFDVVNIGKQSMTIVQLVAAANDDNIATKLFVCKKGACKGNETNVSSWRQVWSGTLKDHKPTTIVIQEIITIESGKKQGFLLHTEKNKVLYSKQKQKYKDSHLLVKPWYATSSDKPHGSPQGGNNKFTLAGDVVYKLSAPTSSARPLNGTETWDMKDVQLICAEKVDKVPVLNMDAFIAYGARTEKVHETIASTSSVQDDSESESAAGSSTSSVQDNSGSGSGSDEDDPGSDDDDSSDDGSSFSVGTEVVLTTDFGDHSDASGGSLEPGDIGTIIETDGSSKPYLVRAANGKEWWYHAEAIEAAPGKVENEEVVETSDAANGGERRSRNVPVFPENEETINIQMHAEHVAQRDGWKKQNAASIKLQRMDSTKFYERNVFQNIANFDDFVSRRDLEGNCIAHHLASGGLIRSLRVLYSENQALRWIQNDLLQTPQMIFDGIRALTPLQAVLHRAIHDGNLLFMNAQQVSVHLINKALQCLSLGCCTDSYEPKLALRDVDDALALGKYTEVLILAARASDPQKHLYCALAMLAEREHSRKQVQMEVHKYLQKIVEDGEACVDPLLYYVHFRLYRQKASKAKSDRQNEACALRALCCFPCVAERWLKNDADAVQSLQNAQDPYLAGDLSEDDLAQDDEKTEVDNEWIIAKNDHGLVSESMDRLMALTGLNEIKKQAMGIVKEVLLQKDRPVSVQAETSMNFLFTGNPGCGKTTVAQLIARVMSELNFRTNPLLVETSAQEILKMKNPGEDFKDMVEKATGGTLFIDEAYRFCPSKQGQQPNASNQVLDCLLEMIERPETRKTTSVILAGYRDEIEDLMTYNRGFASRFPIEFVFPDYAEGQLQKIFVSMVKDRGMRLELIKHCSVDISGIVAQRLHQGAGKKGFGNARSVRNKLEQIIRTQSQRIGNMKLRKQNVSERDFKTLTVLDAIGPKPDFDCCKPMQELDAMSGLRMVKKAFRDLVALMQQNYMREINGDKPEQISLHRVFFGNPGTGKTTVARLYGSLLKEIGLLSRGDFISVTPADLTGDSEGGAATNTKDVLERAKGKVLLIDEAYVLDPRRKNNQYGGNVLDTLVEKLDGEAGSDIAVILAGYKQEMFDMLDNNPGLRRRFNIDDFPFHFQDMSDEELKQVLISMTGKAGLVFGSVELVDDVVAVIAQKRKMPGFGNAGTVGSMINFAKASKAARLAEAQRLFDEAKRKGTSLPTLPDPNVLFRDDFIPHESDDDKAQAAFADLYNTDHIMKHLNKLEALISVAKEDGLEPADILLDSHMVFVGPPGTGKTTVAKRFGRLFKDLDLLPSDNVITVTGTSMMGQYVGETKEKVLKYMNQARGGVLFVDEAYGMMGGSWGTDGGRSSYGKEAIDTMVGSITSDDFKGNLLVIMAGYEESMDSLFANANPGFASRFNKRRIVFNPWTAQQASEAVITEIARRGLTLTPEAEKLVQFYFRKLELLSSWGSARDVFDTVLPKLYEERASRRKASKLSNTEPYQAEDVEAALRPILENRQKLKVYANSTKRTSRASHREREASDVASDVEDHSARAEDSNGATTSYEGKSKHKLNVKHKISRIDDHEDSEDIGSNIDILGALEQACQELGYDEEKFAEILGERGMYPQELLDKVALLTGNIDTANIPSMLDKQKGNFLMRIKMCIEQRKKEKSAEEARCQEALKQMGQCPLGFDWLKEEGGWRCAGGSHFVSDNEIAQC